jgi:surface antigen
MMTPVSLFANITVTRHVVHLISDITSCGTTQPPGDTGTTLTSEQKEKRSHKCTYQAAEEASNDEIFIIIITWGNNY